MHAWLGHYEDQAQVAVDGASVPRLSFERRRRGARMPLIFQAAGVGVVDP